MTDQWSNCRFGGNILTVVSRINRSFVHPKYRFHFKWDIYICCLQNDKTPNKHLSYCYTIDCIHWIKEKKNFVTFRFLWPCIVSKVWREKNQQDATIRCLLLTSISTCFGHHYAHLQENKEPVTGFGVLFCNKRENVGISREVFFVG